MLKPFAEAGRANVMQVLDAIARTRAEGRGLSLIRLGDGEGRLLGYPDIVTRRELQRSLLTWFGALEYRTQDLIGLSRRLRDAVRAADIIGIPRLNQQLMPPYQTVIWSIRYFRLIDSRPMLVDAAIHRYLQFGHFFRNLLSDLDFCGLITCRNLAQPLQRIFRIGRVAQYLIPGESTYLGEYRGIHFPDRFFELEKEIVVPSPGALFLVGAGALGKIYCQWIKEAGGIAIDIGSIFDDWASVRSRPTAACGGIAEYDEVPPLSLGEAAARFNRMCDAFELDTARLSPEQYR